VLRITVSVTVRIAAVRYYHGTRLLSTMVVYGLNVLTAAMLSIQSRSMLRVLKWVSWFSSSKERMFECRQCGTSLEKETESCPGCGSSELAEYQL